MGMGRGVVREWEKWREGEPVLVYKLKNKLFKIIKKSTRNYVSE